MSDPNAATQEMGGNSKIDAPPRPPSSALSPIKKIAPRTKTLEATQEMGMGISMDKLETAKLENLPSATRKNRTLDKLNSSAYLSQSMTLTDVLAARSDKLSKKKEVKQKLPGEETNFDLIRQASQVLSGKYKTQKPKKARASITNEAQGPIDWSCRGLRSKYRGENEREELWKNWQAAHSFSATAMDELQTVIPVVTVTRHPMVELFERLLGEENGRSLTRTKARLLMKRFVMDVHEVWLMNLQHLREHQPAMILAEVDQPETPAQRGFGLKARRDIVAISEMKSQVPSISQKRAMQRSFYTSTMPPPTVKLDYEVGDTPKVVPPKPLPPVMESLIIDQSTTPKDVPGPTSSKNLLVNIERLLPSVDGSFRSVYWRVRAIRGDDVLQHARCFTEQEVEQWVQACIDAQDGPETSLPGGNAELVYEREGTANWSVVEFAAMQRIYIRRGSKGRVRVILEMEAIEEGFEGLTICSAYWAPELLSLMGLEQELATYTTLAASSEGASWWHDIQQREELFNDTFLDSLYVINGDVDVDGNPYPKRIDLFHPKTIADGVDGALSSAKATALAAELYAALTVRSSITDVFPAEETGVISFVFEGPQRLEVANDNSVAVTESWERLVDDLESLSIRASGNMEHTAKSPGSQSFGKMGIVDDFRYRWDAERTQTSAVFFRNARLSSTDSVLVNMTLALDTPVMVEPSLCFGEGVVMPSRMPAEEYDAVIPFLLSKPGTLLREPLKSPIEERLSFPSAIFNTMPIEGIDHVSLQLPTLPEGLIRHWPLRNKYGFRRRRTVELLQPEVDLPTVVFGITKEAAKPNVTGVNARNIWHSTLAISEHINRPRSSSDYHYVVKMEVSHGANDPSAYSIQMKGGEFLDLISLAHEKFEETYGAIQEQRQKLARQMALDAKIENSEVMLRIKEKELELSMQREIQRGIEKKLRKASKSEAGWRRRFKMSTLLELQGNWERRRDDRSGAIFFRRILPGSNLALGDQSKKRKVPEEQFMQTCQWEVPATWDGDPLAEADFEEQSFVTGAPTIPSTLILEQREKRTHGAHAKTPEEAFAEPGEMWMPDDDTSVGDASASATSGQPLTAGARYEQNGIPQDIQGPTLNIDLSNSILRAGDINYKSTSANDGSVPSPSLRNNSMDSEVDRIAQKLVSSDDLIRLLAKRLGLPDSQLVSADNSGYPSQSQTPSGSPGASVKLGFHSSVLSNKGGGGGKTAYFNDDDIDYDDPEHRYAPRDQEEEIEEPEFDSDDDLWSDDGNEAGDMPVELNLGDMPTDHKEVTDIARAQALATKKGSVMVPKNIPFLHLQNKTSSKEEEDVAGWRKLPRPRTDGSFFQKCTGKLTMSSDPESAMKPNDPTFLLPISPVDACAYNPENFEINVESIFIPNAKKDMERALATVQRNIKREEELSRNIPTDELLLFGEPSEQTQVDHFLAKQYEEDQNAFVDPKEAAMEQAILSAKSSNIAEMEDALEEDIPINTADKFGNTLLILAAQQGSKRMVKFLLRRGADINAQNMNGCTVLHYCHAYSHVGLADYLISRGADDSIVNLDGLTCYEGLAYEDIMLED